MMWISLSIMNLVWVMCWNVVEFFVMCVVCLIVFMKGRVFWWSVVEEGVVFWCF